jgi:hypothetical protein
MSRHGPLRDLQGLRLLTGYYLVTPLFAAADLLAGWPLRVAGMPDARARLIYYAAAFGIGLLARARPRWAPVLGVGESSVNLTLLVLSVLGPIWGLLDDPGASEAVVAALPLRVANLALSGGMLAVSLSLALGRWSERVRGGGAGPD